MKLIQPNCRIQFTAADVDFILTVLDPQGEKEQGALVSLLADEHARDEVLDHDDLFEALLEDADCLNVSSRFYFYVLVRHVLKEAGVDDRVVTDYIAEVLTQFSRAECAGGPIPGAAISSEYIFELMEASMRAEDSDRFLIQAHVGNHSLFLSGVFPDRIRARVKRRGAPVLRFYEGMGSTNYKLARDHRLAREYHLDSIYDFLSGRFRHVRQALNDLSERLVFIKHEALPPLLAEGLTGT